MNRFARHILCLALLTLPGCALFGVKKQMAVLDKVVYYTGTVETTDGASTGPLIVVLYDKAPQRKVVFFDVVPTKSGVYHLVAEPGDHGIVAFEDRNDDFEYTAGEPLALLDGQPIDARLDRTAKTAGHIVLSASATALDPAFVDDILGESFAAFAARRSKRFGEVTTLSDPRFSGDRVHDGIFRPVEFIRTTGPGLFMLEPYDADRVPVIFVHGIGGSPLTWTAAIEKLDRNRFQPWVFYYPSGLSLGASAWVLDQAIEGLRARHGFKQCHVVAHSMGGLVARGALNLATREGRVPPVHHLVTISTPWLGQPGARFASSAPIRVPPSWIDMSPDGDYVHQLFVQPLPESVRYTLFFSYAGHSAMRPGNNDGTVPLDSMLAYDAQDRAERVHGFAEDHTTIVSSPAMLSKLAERLASNR